jgi:hypothetical protein
VLPLLQGQMEVLIAMSRKRRHGLLIACGLVAMIAVAGTQLFSVRDMLAAFLLFCVFLVALGIVILASFFVGDGIVRFFDLLVACVASVRLRPPVPSVVPSHMESARVRRASPKPIGLPRAS